MFGKDPRHTDYRLCRADTPGPTRVTPSGPRAGAARVDGAVGDHESLLEQLSTHARLANDAGERADSNFLMVGDRNRDRCPFSLPLHDDVTASTPNLDETGGPKKVADLLARQDPQLTQPVPRRLCA
jgi:hypothetical protein